MVNFKLMIRLPKRFLVLVALLYALTPAMASAEEKADSPEETPAEEPGVTDYISMDPAFVTNVGKPGNKVTYLKAAVTLRASSAEVRPAVEAHMPSLRNALVMLFGEQTDADAITTMDGQKALREEAKARINKILEEQHTGVSIDGVLFTEFVVQK
ncbi:flagellar basal body-associated protein FliL [Marinobacter koreensis]|uniref:Flagellar protein FliL n=1 Tax=Marinobacter koreensis TaxID=335974 RepID=A0ABW0RQI8_9GAMM